VVSYFGAFAWGIVILLSLTGWGGVLSRLLFPKQDTDWGQRAAWGLAVSVVVGGGLNLLSWISRSTVLVYLGLGVVAWLAWIIAALIRRPMRLKNLSQPFPDDRTHKAVWVGAMLAVGLLALIQYAGSVSVTRFDYPSSPAGAVRFNQADDFEAYFVFPKKMLQLGSMGRDPFCARQMESGLGGQSFLDTFVLGVFSPQHLHVLDPGLGLLLIIGLLWGHFKQRGISPAWSAAMLALFVWTDPPTVNISSLYTGMALFLSLYRTLDWKALPASSFLSRTILLALTAAAICALKSTFIPACGVLVACSFIAYVISQRSKREAIAETAVTAFLIMAFNLPWMISMYQSSHTLLYPLLGRGYHRAYAWLTVSGGARLLLQHFAEPIPAALVGLGVFYLVSRRREISGREAELSLLVAAVVGHVAVTLATGGGASVNARYSFAFIFAAILVLITEAVSSSPAAGQNKWRASGPLVATGVTLFLVGATWFPSRTFYTECLQAIRLGVQRALLVSNFEMAAYQRLQQSIPPGAVVLTRLEKPFLLDFRRNTVFLVDYAVVSPPPGMPLAQGGEALQRYLASQSIRYVAYTYGGEADRQAVITKDIYPPFAVFQLQSTSDFEDELEELAKRTRRIYDDGRSFVLDLSQPSPSSAPD
jgi:hypothetical protein